jgi:DNA-binding FadR family transcriptional regulator
MAQQWTLGPRQGAVRSRKVADLIASRLRKMIARGELEEGDWLPTEPELITQFGVSRPTLREAFRLLEGDGLIQIRRGPPGGARVTLPGPEGAAPIFGLILTLSGTTLQDVQEARLIIEPPAVNQLAQHATPADVGLLRAELENVKSAVEDPDTFARAGAQFHLLLVQLSGNHTLAAVVGMLSEITSRHVALGYRETRRPADEVAKEIQRVIRAYGKLISLVEDRKGPEAEAFWRRHMNAAMKLLLADTGAAQDVVDVID